MSGAAATSSRRDPRIDVLRGLALLMIFVDHMPFDVLNRVTLHNFGFCDAAEIFVLLAGFSSMLAYGKHIQQFGIKVGLGKIMRRCGRIYVYQIGLMVTTLGVAVIWTSYFHMTSSIMAPILNAPARGLTHELTLRALPQYLDILPLYIVLLAAFPLIYFAVRRNIWLALGGSALVWLIANIFPSLDLPNWMDGHGWYFNPFTWQLLFTIGAVLAAAMGKGLPVSSLGFWLAVAFLIFAALESFPWGDWGLPDLRPIAMATPDKSSLAPLRVLDILALMYVLLVDPRTVRIAQSIWLRPLEACGRHSLEVFSTGCILALFGRMAFRAAGQGPAMQIVVNVAGLGMMCWLGLWLDRHRAAAPGSIPVRHRTRGTLDERPIVPHHT